MSKKNEIQASSGESDWHHTVIRSKVKLQINQSSEIKKKTRGRVESFSAIYELWIN